MKTLERAWWWCACVTILVLGTAWGCGVRLNMTESIPRGLYVVSRGAPSSVGVGELVCLDTASRLSPLEARRGESWPLLKRVAAVGGARVERNPSTGQLSIDGVLLPCSDVFVTDSTGAPLPVQHFPLVVPAGSVWLSSEHSRGWDSRYFGPVSLSALTCTRARPLWLWDGGERC